MCTVKVGDKFGILSVPSLFWTLPIIGDENHIKDVVRWEYYESGFTDEIGLENQYEVRLHQAPEDSRLQDYKKDDLPAPLVIGSFDFGTYLYLGEVDEEKYMADFPVVKMFKDELWQAGIDFKKQVEKFSEQSKGEQQ